MAKRRDRRLASTSDNRRSDRQRGQTEVPSEPDGLVGTSSDRKSVIIFLFFFVVLPAVSVFVYRMKYAPPPDTSRIVSSLNPLVKTDVTYREILSENSKVVSEKNASRGHSFMNPVLVYVTPWNSRGYELAKRFSSKFTHISPVWYDLKSRDGSLILDGRHNADEGWISELRMRGGAQLLPRVVMEAAPYDLLRKKKQRAKAIKLIVTECKEMGYDGIVLESWSRWMAYGILNDPNMRNLALKFIQELGEALHSVKSKKSAKQQQLQLVYVIGPPHSEKLEAHDFGAADLQSLSSYVDGFSLMTYDFSNPGSPGPNAPLNWISFVLKLLLGTTGKGSQGLAHKIFLGINFYGNDFILPGGGLGVGGGGGGGAIVGAEYLSLLEKYKPSVQWEKKSREHFFLYTTTTTSFGDDDEKNKEASHSHAVFYPSLMSIFTRLEEARSWGTGISIWEIGQGLDYFFDLF